MRFYFCKSFIPRSEGPPLRYKKFVFVCIAFKNAGDRLTCQKSAQYLQAYRKKSGKLPSVQFTKSKARNLRKINEV